MKLGFLTACLPALELETIADWAAAHGFEALEVATWPEVEFAAVRGEPHRGHYARCCQG